jgi:hypothetical protein
MEKIEIIPETKIGDLALAIEILVPQAKYGGSTTSNTEAQFNSLRWEDERKKPTWAELGQAWSKYVPKVEVTIEQRIKTLEDTVKVLSTDTKEII